MSTDVLAIELRSIAANPGIIREAADRLDELSARVAELEALIDEFDASRR